MNNSQFDMDTVNRFFEHDYHDRGMVKWQGFYLSDHTAALQQLKTQTAKQYPAKPQQPLVEIGRTLVLAYQQHYAVLIQLNTVNQNDQHTPTITTSVLGYNGETIIISDHQFINIQTIRNIELTA